MSEERALVQTWLAVCRFTGDPGCLGWPGWHDHPRQACVWDKVLETSCPVCGWTDLTDDGPHDAADCRRAPDAASGGGGG